MLNHIILHGRLVRDPELKRTQSGTAVCSFTLAVDRDVKNQDGTRAADFIDCVAWRGTAEHLCKFFGKGSLAIVEGRLELRDWTDRDNNKRRSAEVHVSGLYFGDSKRKTESAPQGYPAYSEPAYGGGADLAEIGDDDSELPF